MIVRLMDKYRLYVYEDKKNNFPFISIDISVIIQKYKSVFQGQNLEKFVVGKINYERIINESSARI